VLTYIPEYFKKFGYKTVSRAKLPHKIWKDCINCPKFPDCGEIPMVKALR
jgi:amino-acid N-acetyltransferase